MRDTRATLLYVDSGPRHTRKVYRGRVAAAALAKGLLRVVRGRYVVTCAGSHYLGTFRWVDL